MSSVEKEADDIIERQLILTRIAEGVPPLLAAIEFDWSPFRWRREMEDPDFAMMVEFAKDQDLDELEKVLNGMAKKEHFGALQMILYNKRPHVWQDVKKIQMQTTHEIGPATIAAVRGELAAVLRTLGPAVLQIGGPLDEDIVDAEVVGEG